MWPVTRRKAEVFRIMLVMPHQNVEGTYRMLGTIHIVLAIASLVLGAVVLLQKKGGKRHRRLGYLYSVALLLVNLSALSVYEESEGPGPFHVLALISLATLIAGFAPAFLRKPRNAWMNLHAYFMSWSYVGLVAAGVAQMATKVSSLPGVIAVGLPSVLIVVGGGLLIHRQVPQALIALTSRNVRPNKRMDADEGRIGQSRK